MHLGRPFIFNELPLPLQQSPEMKLQEPLGLWEFTEGAERTVEGRLLG